MRITEVLTESKQLDELDIGQGINKVARGAGKAIGGVGKAVGAVAGIPQGLGRAIKKGYKSSVQTIGGDLETGTAPSTSTAGKTVAATPSTSTTATKPSASGKQSTFDKLSTAAFGGEPQHSSADLRTVYSQIKSQLDQLSKRDKQRLLVQLQKSLGQSPVAAPVQQPIVQKTVTAKAPVARKRTVKQQAPAASIQPTATTAQPGYLQSLIDRQIAARNAKRQTTKKPAAKSTAGTTPRTR